MEQGKAVPGRPISLQLGSCGPRSPEGRQAAFLHLYLGLLLTLLKGSQGPRGRVCEAGSSRDRGEHLCSVEETLSQESAEAAKGPKPSGDSIDPYGDQSQDGSAPFAQGQNDTSRSR